MLSKLWGWEVVSLPMEKSEDLARIQMCLDGFQLAIHSTAVHGLLTVRDAFVQSLAKFTLLHDPANMSRKNVDAIKVASLPPALPSATRV